MATSTKIIHKTLRGALFGDGRHKCSEWRGRPPRADHCAHASVCPRCQRWGRGVSIPPKQLHVTIIRFLVLILPSFPSPFLSLSSTYSAEQGYAADAAEAAKAAGIASTFAANTAAGGAATRSRMKGVVKRWVINGYGFIQPEDDKSGNGNLFCHYSEITDGNMLAEGAAVEFEKQWSDQKRTFCAKRSPKANNPIPAVPRTSTWERTEKDQHMSGVLVTSTCILSAHAHHPCEANNTKMKRQEIHVLIERENTLVLTGCLLL